MSEENLNYYIDLNRVYENMPNQAWDTPAPFSVDTAIYSLHHNIAKKQIRKIWNSVNSNVQNINIRNGSWSNLNFIISGGRGCGKSTFLRYLTHTLINGFSQEKGEDISFPHQPAIRKLFFCDPTAMTTKEDFLVSIVGAFYDWVAKAPGTNDEPGHYKITGGEHKNESGYHTHDFRMHTPSHSCKELIEEMARGIKLLNAEASSSNGLDPLSRLKQGFVNSNRALELKSKFDQMVNMIAREYNVDAFLIAIDDADVDSGENRHIMETIRKYLTHPRLIILFTCDMLLANETIREKHFAQFSPQYHELDVLHQMQRWNIVDNMSAQYIKKIFPASNHIELRSLYDVAQEAKGRYHIVFHTQPERKEVKVGLEYIVSQVFMDTMSEDRWNAEVFMEAFLRLPLRSILTTFRYWDDHGFTKFIKKAEDDQIEERFVLDVQQDDEKRKELERMVADAFRIANFNELISSGYTQEELESDSCYQFSKALLRHSVLCNDLSQGYGLTKYSAIHSHPEAALMLASKAPQVISDFGDTLSYILFGIFTIQVYKYYRRHALENAQPLRASKYDELSQHQFTQSVYQEFCLYMLSGDNRDPMRRARKISIIYACHQLASHAAPNEERKLGKGNISNILLNRGVMLLSDDKDVRIVDELLNRLYDKLMKKPAAIQFIEAALDKMERDNEQADDIWREALKGIRKHLQNIYQGSIGYLSGSPFEYQYGMDILEKVNNCIVKLIEKSQTKQSYDRNSSKLISQISDILFDIRFHGKIRIDDPPIQNILSGIICSMIKNALMSDFLQVAYDYKNTEEQDKIRSKQLAILQIFEQLIHEASHFRDYRIEEEAKQDVSQEEKIIAFMAYTVLRILCGQMSSSRHLYYLSLYNVIGFITGCYNCYKNNTMKGNDEPSHEALRDYIHDFLVEKIPVNSSPSWAVDSGHICMNTVISHDIQSTPELFVYAERLAAIMHVWCDKQTSYIPGKAPALGQIADRIYSSISSVSNALFAELSAREAQEGLEQSHIHSLLYYSLVRFSHWNQDETFGRIEVMNSLKDFFVFSRVREIALQMYYLESEVSTSLKKSGDFIKELEKLRESDVKLKTAQSKAKKQIGQTLEPFKEEQFNIPTGLAEKFQTPDYAQKIFLRIYTSLINCDSQTSSLKDYKEIFEKIPIKEQYIHREAFRNMLLEHRLFLGNWRRWERNQALELKNILISMLNNLKRNIAERMKEAKDKWEKACEVLFKLLSDSDPLMSLDALDIYVSKVLPIYKELIPFMTRADDATEKLKTVIGTLQKLEIIKKLFDYVMINSDFLAENIEMTTLMLAETANEYNDLNFLISARFKEAASIMTGSLNEYENILQKRIDAITEAEVVNKNEFMAKMQAEKACLDSILKSFQAPDKDFPLARDFPVCFNVTTAYSNVQKAYNNLQELLLLTPTH